MSSIRARKDGRLFFDFYYRGERCRELTVMNDTVANRRKMKRALKRIDAEIAAGTFDYGRTFPTSRKAAKFSRAPVQPQATLLQMGPQAQEPDFPTMEEFARRWVADKQVEWRQSYRDAMDSILNAHILPEFGDRALNEIDRASVLRFRTALIDKPGRVSSSESPGCKGLAPSTVNRIVGVISMIMDEAALRFGLDNPCAGIRRLKVRRKDIQPFTLQEMRSILHHVRSDYRPYLTFRFLTGLRSGEVHGLKWKHVDFERRQVLIRETYQKGRTEYTKTDGSQREIYMSEPVLDALMQMCPARQDEDMVTYAERYVFTTRNGGPIDNTNFTNRVWKPLLRSLDLQYRRPYNMRHTCATLWLAAGESPEWIARQLGHTTTEMLFRTYSRYVPNMVRHDGTAFNRLVTAAMNGGVNETGRSANEQQ